MNPRSCIVTILAAVALASAPAFAQRGHHGHGGGHFWGPFGGLVLGSAIVYSAMQPRTVYYQPRVTYWPYGPVAMVGPDSASAYYADPSYAGPPATSIPPPPQGGAQVSALSAPGSEWWYFCKDPNGYYPYVRDCKTGWEKISPTPPGAVKP